MAVVISFVGKFDGKDLERAQREMAKLSGVADDSGSRMGGLRKAGLAAAAGIAVAAAATVKFGADSISAAREAQVADKRLQQIATSMGLVDGAYAGGIDRLNDYAGTLSKTLGVEDESIKAVQAKLLTFKQLGVTINESGGALDRATQAAYDLAAAGFGSAETNAIQLGKALQDPVKGLTALGRAGITFTAAEKERIKALVESGKVQEAQNLVLKAIESQVGGTAAATATAADRMKIAFGELQESVGVALLPVMEQFASTLTPIIEQLQGPLSQVAGQVAGALQQAFDALAPVLPTVAQALGQIAGVIGQSLATAIRVLVPIITPMMEILASLATRIGPLLQPILEKLGELIGKLFTAVEPLIAPLTDLIFGVLEAAMPILDIVGDLLGVLIDAIAPLLGIVGSLLAPLGQLINVLFKAIEPILRPLLPLIEALAGLFADVLARAIGVIITGLGQLILAGSKVAPFLLNNLTKPVIEGFLTMAENIIGSAESAFGWIPGLGDKLRTAKDAIATFKTSATTAIGQAATTIAKEGQKIGTGLIDQGIALVTNPAQVAKVKKAGESVGFSLSEGMRMGIVSGQIPLQAAAAQSINQAERAARVAADSNSPSKLFAAIGRDLTSGLVEGVKEGGKDVRKNLQEQFNAWFKDTVDKLRSKLEDARSAFNQFRDSVRNAIMGAFSFGDAMSGAKERAKAIADATAAYQEAAAKAADPEATEADKKALVNAASDLEFARQQGAALGLNFMDSLKAQAAQAVAFADKVKQLITMNLSKEALQQVLAAGVTAGTEIADQLINGGATAITETNRLVAETQKAADEVGDMAAGHWYGAGVKSAQDTYDGFKANFGKDGPARKALMSVMDNLAAAAARDVRIDVAVTRSINEVVTRVVQTITAPGVEGAGATGGIINRPTIALIGEAGPEALVPLDRTPGNGPLPAMGGGNTYNISVSAGVGDPRQIGQQIVQYIKRFEQSSGGAAPAGSYMVA